MTSSDAARLDLYTGLTELLGPERTETLMAALPPFDITDLKRDMDTRFEHVDKRFEQVDKRFDRMDAQFDRIDARFDSIGARLDRLFLALVAGLFIVIGSMATLVLVG